MRKSKVTGAFKPTSLIMPCIDIVLLFALGFSGRYDIILFIPPVISVVLILVFQLNIIEHLAPQLFIDVIELMLIILLLGAGAGIFHLPEILGTAGLWLTVITPVVINGVIYAKITHSKKMTAALVLCDPALIWAVFGTILLVAVS